MRLIDGSTVASIFLSSAALSAALTVMIKRQGAMIKREERALVSEEMKEYMARAAIGGAKRGHSTRPTMPGRLSQGPVMMVEIDSSMVTGAGVLLGSAALGAGMISFVENQNERTNERGVVGDETKSRMAAQYTRDEKLVTDVSGTIAEMEKAIAVAEGREVTVDGGFEKESVLGWGD